MKTPKPDAAESTAFYDVETLKAMAMKVMAEGFVPAEALKEEFGPQKSTQGIAVLFRQFRMFREVNRPWKDSGASVMGYEWADRRFSQAESKKIPGDLGFLVEMTKGSRAKYADYEAVSIRCRWTNWTLGALPRDRDGGSVNCFLRDATDTCVIPAYCVRAMLTKALPLIGKEQAIAWRIYPKAIRVLGDPKIQGQPKVDEGTHQGLGITQSEAFPPGTEFTIAAMIPTSILSVADFARLIAIAGEYVRLSHGRSAGYGDFEPIV